MNVSVQTSGERNTHGGDSNPPRTGLAPDALPDSLKPAPAEESPMGVSTQNAVPAPTPILRRKSSKEAHWYALRTTYGREKKAYEYLIKQNVVAFYPTMRVMNVVDGKKRMMEVSRLSNIFFAFGTEEEIKSYVYDNANLPYLRFYYRHTHVGSQILKEPLIVPDDQIKSLQIICAAEAADIILVPDNVQKFKNGQRVRIIDGLFKGVTGQVARYSGQQRVAVTIDGLLTIATAYIPSAFLMEVKE